MIMIGVIILAYTSMPANLEELPIAIVKEDLEQVVDRQLDN